MAISNPSQYECDNAQKGDLVFIRKRSSIYKWYRKWFLKDKIKINIRKDWETEERVTVYQEDCTLLFSWEIQGKSEYLDEVPYYIGFKTNFIKSGNLLKKLQFGSENICIVLKSGFSILIPTSAIRNGLNKMDNVRKDIDENRQIQQALKFARYKGDFFKKRCKELELTEWTISYCIVCGNSVKIKFDKEEPYIENCCDCGNMMVKSEPITWDTVAFWYNSRTQQPVIDKYKEFWKI